MKPIFVINPNSNQAVTGGIDEAVEPFRLADGPPIECVTLEAGPLGIETDAHVNAVLAPVCDLMVDLEPDSSAFVIACYSDPGLQRARTLTALPVFGIAESAMLVALSRGSRFGVISILEGSIARHERYVRTLGLESRAAGDRAIGLGVTELTNDDRAFARIASVGRELRDEDDANVLILGCAGMSRYRDRLEEAVGLPVIDPTQAAVTMAVGAVLLYAGDRRG